MGIDSTPDNLRIVTTTKYRYDYSVKVTTFQERAFCSLLTRVIADPERGLHGMREIFPFEPQRQMNEVYENGDFDQGPNDCCEGLPRVDAEDGYGHSNGKLKVVGCRSEGKGGGLAIVCPCLGAHIKGHEKHNDEIDEERYGDSYNIKGYLNDELTLQREHDKNGEEESDERNRADLRDKLLVVPCLVFYFDEHKPRDNAGNKRDSEIDKNALGNLADRNIDYNPFQSHEGWENGDEEIGINREEKDLEDGVKSHEPCTVFSVPLGQVVPDDDHGDAAGQADQDEPHHVVGIAS